MDQELHNAIIQPHVVIRIKRHDPFKGDVSKADQRLMEGMKKLKDITFDS